MAFNTDDSDTTIRNTFWYFPNPPIFLNYAVIIHDENKYDKAKVN
jgi:hypothetical protein